MSLKMFVKQFGHKLLTKRLNGFLNNNNIENKILIQNMFKENKRCIGSSMGRNSYEGDGKTTVTIINKDYTGYLLVDAYSEKGFRLSNGWFAFGPIALFPATILQWDVKDVHDIHEESLSLFFLVEPKIEVLVIGIGDEKVEVSPRLRLLISKMKINCEVLSTKHAVSTYNFLNSDHRVCAGAFIPPGFADIDPEVDPFLTGAKNRFISETGILG